MSQPILTTILTADELIPTPYQAFSLVEAVAYEPSGVYTVARTFHGDQVLLFDAHLDRLEESARLVDIPFRLDRQRLRAGLRDLLQRSGYSDAKFRITVPRSSPEQLYLALEPFHPVPEAVQRNGAHVATVPASRSNPVVKVTDWMTQRRPITDRLPEGVYEGILTREDGSMLEGTSSNFYAVLNGVLYTSGEGVLAGITRRAILNIAPTLLPVDLTPPNRQDIARFSEAMLTSSGRGVVPITQINDQPTGDGQVGPLVSEIRRRYDEWTEAHLEPV